MEEKIQALEQRVANLERKIDILIGNRIPDKIPPVPAQTVKKTEQSVKVNPEKSNKSLLPILAVICFFMAGIFLVKLAIDSGWLNPFRQWLMLIMFGASLGGVSLLVEKIEKNYRSYLGAASVVLMFLAAFSGSLYFELYNEFVSVFLAGVITFFALYLNQFFQYELFGVIAIVGTYISPLMLGKTYDLTFLSIFYLIWAALFSRIATALKSRVLVLVASYLALGTFISLNLNEANPDTLLIIILVQAMQFIIFAMGVLYYSIKNETKLTSQEAFAYLPILLFFYGTMYFLLNKYNPTMAPYISLGFGGFLYFIYFIGKKHLDNLQSGEMVKAFLGVIIFHSGYLELLPATAKPWLLPSVLLAYGIAEQKNHKWSPILNFIFTAISFIEFVKLCASLLMEASLYSLLPAIFTTLVGAYFYLGKKESNSSKLFLYLLHILNVLAIYRLMYDFGSLMVTVGWAIYSIAILGFSFKNRNVLLAKSSLLVFGVTALKALLYDVSLAPSIVRVGSLMLTGLVLYGAGYFFRIIDTWDKEKT